MIKDIMKEERFKGVGPTMMKDKLEDMYGIKVSKEKVRGIMIEEHKRTPRKGKDSTYRSRRPRRSYYGELAQFDGSYHKRIP
jgi:hypothetical protein